jgi:hypothetical protein
LGLRPRSGHALRQLPVRVWVPGRKIPVRRERPPKGLGTRRSTADDGAELET